MSETLSVFLFFLVVIGAFIGWVAFLMWLISHSKRLIPFLITLVLGLAIGATFISVMAKRAAERAACPTTEATP